MKVEVKQSKIGVGDNMAARGYLEANHEPGYGSINSHLGLCWLCRA